MSWLNDTLHHVFPRLWLAGREVGRRRQVEAELDEEIAFHLEMEAALLERQGTPPAEARRQALLRFGGVERCKEEVRELRFFSWLESLGQDVRHGLRSLAHQPGFTAAALLTLALGIGANTAIFSLVHGVLLAPLPYEGGDRLMLLRQQAPGVGIEDGGLSALEIEDYRAAGSLDGLAEYHSMWFNLLGRGEPLRVSAGVVSWRFFDLLGVRPAIGRGFEAADERPGAEAVLLLSHAFWQQKMAGDPAVVGEVFEMNDRAHTVIGVLPPVPLYPQADDVYMTTVACPFRSNPNNATNREARSLLAFGRLRPGVGPEEAQADVAAVASRMAAEHPETYPPEAAFGVRLLSLRGELTGAARPVLWLLFGTVGLVLLAACANVGSLSLARILSRQGDLALRSALGAPRRRILQQLLVEALMLCLAGGALGVVVAVGGLDLLLSFARRLSPRAAEVELGGGVLLFTLGVSLLTGLALGFLASLQVSRMQPVWGPRGGRHSRLRQRLARGAGRTGLRSFLVMAQLAVSVVLLIGAGLMVKSLVQLSRVDPGFDGENVVGARIDLDWSEYRDAAGMRAFYHRLLERLESLPGVESAAIASQVPLTGAMDSSLVTIEGEESTGDRPRARSEVRRVSPDYFRTLRIPVLRGRGFTAGDDAGATPVGVVSAAMARRHLGSRDPLGRRIRLERLEQPVLLVGVVGDVHQDDLAGSVADEIYLPLAQIGGLSATVLVRASGDPAALGAQIRAAVFALDPQQPVFDVQAMDSLRREVVASPRLTASLLGLFAGLALAITLTGVGGLLAFTVSQRRQEIGVRMALGARPGSVLALVLGQGLRLVALGLAAGLAGGLALSHLVAARLFDGLLFEVEPTDPATYLSVSLLLLAVAAAACLLPARRAVRIQPMNVLRDS